MDQLAVCQPHLLQGGAVYTQPVDLNVDSVQIFLQSEGRPLNCRIELLQGPNNVKQVMEVYTEDGLERSFFTIVQTPGLNNVVRIVNTATIEFPISASIVPWTINDDVPILITDSGLEDRRTTTSSSSPPLLELGGNRQWGNDFFRR
jgi:hypothetical protein